MGDACLRQIGSCLDVGEEDRRMGSHRGQFAPHIVADPQAVVGGKSIERISISSCRRASSCEGVDRFGRCVAACGHECIAIGRVDVLPLSKSPSAFVSGALSAMAIALPRWAMASWKAERRSAWSPAFPHHSMASSSRPACVKWWAMTSGLAAAYSSCPTRICAARRCSAWRRLLSRLSWAASWIIASSSDNLRAMRRPRR